MFESIYFFLMNKTANILSLVVCTSVHAYMHAEGMWCISYRVLVALQQLHVVDLIGQNVVG